MRSLRRLVLPTAIAVATALTLGGPASAAVVESAAPSVPAATVSAGHPATTASAENFETALYFYKKIDEGKRAAWKNSGKQYLVTTWEGKDFRTTLDAALLDDVEGVGEICGAGWGVQQDVVDLHKADGEDFTFPPTSRSRRTTSGGRRSSTRTTGTWRSSSRFPSAARSCRRRRPCRSRLRAVSRSRTR